MNVSAPPIKHRSCSLVDEYRRFRIDFAASMLMAEYIEAGDETLL